MKPRNDPTDQQLMRRFRRPPESNRDPRAKNDSYWALRLQGYPHSYAKRALRDTPPVIRERIVSNAPADPETHDEMLFPPGTVYTEVDIAIRPILSQESLCRLENRRSEYTVWDEQVRGLGIRVRPSGHKTFVVYFKNADGKLKKVTLGTIDRISLQQARETARSYRNNAKFSGGAEYMECDASWTVTPSLPRSPAQENQFDADDDIVL